MNHEPNEFENTPEADAQLTAFVLGELAEHDAAAVAERVEGDDAVRREVDAIRAVVAQVDEALADEPAPGLTREQREAITGAGAAMGGRNGVLFSFLSLRTVWAGGALAAAACLVFAVAWPTIRTPRRPDTVAMQRTETEAPASFDDAAGASAKEDADRARSLSDSDLARDEKGVWLQSQPPTRPTGEPLAEATTGREAKLEDVLRRANEIRQSAAAGPAGRLATNGALVGGKDLVAPEQQVVTGSSLAGEGAGFAGGRDRAAGAPAAASIPAVERREKGAPKKRRAPGIGLAGADEVFRAKVLDRRQDAPTGDGAADFDPIAQSVEEAAEDSWSFQTLGAPLAPPADPNASNREAYDRLVDNEFRRPTEDPLSTFSIDVDTAAYANVRRYIESGRLPPKDAVRIEELINYFDYDYEPATGEHPFSVTTEVNTCPWNEAHRLVRIGLRGRDVERDMRPATNLVFLLDVSGSMKDANKLPLVKESLALLVKHLTADDRVAIVVYAGPSGLVLPPTFCDEREKIYRAIDNLHAGGPTNGGAGIELAYNVAAESFVEGGVNRVVLCTDGDFNVGVSSAGDLLRLIEEKRRSGVFLSVLGFGTGNLQDDRMEKLSNAGNGNFAYIDGISEARKVLVEEMSGTLVTIAKDVKIQVEFNPLRVGAYRLIGYANRLLAAQDFDDDTKDAGEIGAGHTVTALYEIAPPGTDLDDLNASARRKLRFQEPAAPNEQALTDELLVVDLRYKAPDADASTLIRHIVADDSSSARAATADFRFAAAVAGFGMQLRDAADKGAVDYDMILELAGAGAEVEAAPATDEATTPGERRREFIEMVRRARRISDR